MEKTKADALTLALADVVLEHHMTTNELLTSIHAVLHRELPACYAKAAEHEPVFVLRGQDAVAPTAVYIWAVEAEKHGCPPEKIADARYIATAMAKWPTRKYPD